MVISRYVMSLSALALASCATVPMEQAEVALAAPSPAETSEDARVAELLSRMSVESKVAQLVMPDIGSITPDDVRRYRFGTILNGGNSGPYGNDLGPAEDWLRLADEFWAASTAPLADGEPVIPSIWATDAMHGHSNVIGATLFPHNIGLGATRDPDLIRRIGEATAIEIEVTGLDWTFAPTIAVARDDRWGRTYESYSEDPALVAQLGVAMVEGLQGRPGSPDYLGEGRVLATAKHFFGDGGTERGVDQGDVNGDLADLMALHAAPYPPVIEAGVEGIMASFNSVNGTKMHGNEALLTGVLREQMEFDGLVVGDWNGHGQVAGCSDTDCPQSLLAGLDVYMVPEQWQGLYETLLRQVQDGTIPMGRLDEAAGRVLRMKLRAGLLDDGAVRPSDRANAGEWGLLGNPEHRALAREAVAESLVLLKNDGVLPLRSGANVLVAGSAADDIAQAAGGWTLTWQGGGELTNDLFPGATSIWRGISDAVEESGGSATLSADGSFADRPDVAIVVFGEEPYAEFAGDRPDLVFRDEEGLELLRAFAEQDIPTVAVFLSGRPMWVNRELNLADAFVAAWLPGSEGAGVADVLTGSVPATGRLSFSWPANCDGEPLNGPDGALFAFGYGRSLDDTTPLPMLDEECAALAAVSTGEWFASGRVGDGVTASVDGAELVGLRGSSGSFNARGIDRDAQEDAREFVLGAGSVLTLSGPGESEAYRVAYELPARPTGAVHIVSGESRYDATMDFEVAAQKGWREMVLTSECLADLGSTIAIETEAPLTLRISAIGREEIAGEAPCSF